MKSKATRFASAAVIVLAVALLVIVLNHSSTPVWAIDQSIEAVSQSGALVIEGRDSERAWREDSSLEQRPFKSWSVANEDQTMIEKYRHEVNGVPTIVTNGQTTWRYNIETNTVRIEDQPYIASECWLGSQFLAQIKSFVGSVITNWEGQAALVGKKLTYCESLPDDLFEFEVPEGATVIEE